MASAFQFHIEYPSKAESWQALWSCALAADAEPEQRTLYSDACSGLIFNFGEALAIDGVAVQQGVYVDPVSDSASTIRFPAGSNIAGIRFLPNVGYDIIGKPTTISPLAPTLPLAETLWSLFYTLQSVPEHRQRVALLKQAVSLSPLQQALALAKANVFDSLSKAALSDRQKERICQQRMGIGPKKVNRLLRVKDAVEGLKQQPLVDLAGLAFEHGFYDQAHMTREFKKIAKATPKQVQQRYRAKS